MMRWSFFIVKETQIEEEIHKVCFIISTQMRRLETSSMKLPSVLPFPTPIFLIFFQQTRWNQKFLLERLMSLYNWMYVFITLFGATTCHNKTPVRESFCLPVFSYCFVGVWCVWDTMIRTLYHFSFGPFKYFSRDIKHCNCPTS